jgi:hypothetical protein
MKYVYFQRGDEEVVTELGTVNPLSSLIADEHSSSSFPFHNSTIIHASHPF